MPDRPAHDGAPPAPRTPITVRALEPADAADAHRLAAHARLLPVTAARCPSGRGGWARWLTELPVERDAVVGAFEGPTLVGLGALTGHAHPRMRHGARVWVVVDPSRWREGIGRTLLGALVEASDAWWGHVRLEASVPSEDEGALGLGRSVGFEVEVTKRAAVPAGGAPASTLVLGRLRPNFVRPEPLGAAPDVPVRRAPLPASSILVRLCRPGDAAALAQIGRSPSAMEGTLGMPFMSLREWEARLSSSEARARVLVAVVAGAVVGSVALFPRVHGETVGLGMTVAPSMQGLGLGAVLLGAALEAADKLRSVRRVELEVYADNARARALYRAHGFEDEGVLRALAARRGTFVDAHVMSRLRPSPPRPR